METSDSNTKAGGEGVIKFELEHHPSAALPNEATRELRGWFRICRQAGLLGQSPQRYAGAAWGNLSRRWKNGFVITCTQVSGQTTLTATDLAWVDNFDLDANRLTAHGPCKASSEAMTHGMIYQALPQVQAVFHAHAPEIWRQAKALEIPVTDPQAEYGTPEMAKAVRQLLAQRHKPEGVFSMGGHEDGVVSYATSIDAAACLMLRLLARALAMQA